MKIRDLENGTIYEGELIEIDMSYYNNIARINLTKANNVEFNKPVRYQFIIDGVKYEIVK